MPSPDALAGASLAIGQAVGAYQFFLPRLTDVRKSSSEDVSQRGDVRIGMLAAASLSIGVGAILSSLIGNMIPLIVSIITGIIITVLYEIALRGDRLFEGV